MTFPESTERQARAAWYRPKISVVSASIVVAALVAFAVFYVLLGALGNSSCDIYCGPPAGFLGVLILIPVTLVLWLAGVIVAAVAVGVSRARSWLAWAALGLSVVIPVVVMIGAANIGWSNLVSY